MCYRFTKTPFVLTLMMIGFSTVAADIPGVKIIAENAAFHELIDIDTRPEIITDKAAWAEGPVCTPEGLFIFSDVKQNRVMSWSEKQGLKTWLAPSDYQNGHAVDDEGRIIAASHGRRAVLRHEHDGTWITLAGSWEGRRLNSPNDVTVAPDGAIWFTDPTFGVLSREESYGGKPELDGEYVYRYDSTSHRLLRANTPEVHSPNGLAFSPDGKTLYISDTQLAHDFSNKKFAHRIMAYRVDGTRLTGGHVFAEVTPGIPDGIKTDEKGNVWSSSKEGVQVFSEQGGRLGKILVPSEDTGNLALCRGSDGRKWLYITAANLVLRLPVKVNDAGQNQSGRNPKGS
ncbi:SMP-30/gluconolactonase/LRE family protein [Pantoea agglomerans]|uniref:SMP-30/gluconolactonase/LRE family protein n=2 Tax=Pantoea TaxID=53335 RepID=UPI00068A6B36|nr:SMP-30/gluconolactonase/LRE family protein [Pantoea agglomerans]